MKDLKILKQIKLTDSEKKELFARIAIKTGLHQYLVQSPFYKFSFLLQTKYMKIGVLALLLLSFSGVTAFASLNALPGDLLYGIKTDIIEKVPLLIPLSSEKRAEINSDNINKRIQEFEKLAEKGKLTEENNKIIEKNINQNLDDFNNHMREIKQKNNDNNNEVKNKLENDLESKIQKHSGRIEEIRQDDKIINKDALDSILNRMSGGDNIGAELD